MSKWVIEIRNLSKSYRDLKALDNVSFRVRQGDIYGLMGHNGAGKTTLLKMLIGLNRPDAGNASIAGYDIEKNSLAVRKVTGYLPQEFGLPGYMSPVELLNNIGALYGLPREEMKEKSDMILQKIGLQRYQNKKISSFSKGMKQIIAIGSVLLTTPKVILLDEPTASLDPIGRNAVLSLLKELSTQGTTILLSTHILSDVESTCNQVGIIHYGKILADTSLLELKQQYPNKSLEQIYLEIALKQQKSSNKEVFVQ